ncbi:MAG: hypothetical protein KJS92_06535, partial [Bacteroidetes bacterium]|nr:hypothetical protein [Bacteroidota bacterium]
LIMNSSLCKMRFGLPLLGKRNMDLLNSLLEILKYTLPSLVVFLTASYLMKIQSRETLQKMAMESRKLNQNLITPVRLQAYERMVLFLERISPNQLIINLNQPNMSAHALRADMLTTVNQEFAYNVSQQVYISAQAWNVIKVVKEQVIQMINAHYELMPEHAMAPDLSRAIIETLMKGENQPTQKAIDFLKAELNLYF